MQPPWRLLGARVGSAQPPVVWQIHVIGCRATRWDSCWPSLCIGIAAQDPQSALVMLDGHCTFWPLLQEVYSLRCTCIFSCQASFAFECGLSGGVTQFQALCSSVTKEETKQGSLCCSFGKARAVAHAISQNKDSGRATNCAMFSWGNKNAPRSDLQRNMGKLELVPPCASSNPQMDLRPLDIGFQQTVWGTLVNQQPGVQRVSMQSVVWLLAEGL